MQHLTNIKIPNDSILIDFKEHLDLDLNERILFTAPFGSGKSTFIDEFKESNEDEYRFIRLYPVNYAVSANEDVFELIKFDILYELMAQYKNEINLQKDDFYLMLRSYMFLRYKMDKKALVTGLLDIGGEIGKPLNSLVKVIWNTYDEFITYNEDIEKNELKQIEAFFKEKTGTIGNPNEMNSLSEIIYSLIDQLKGEKQDESKQRKYKTVLVIDDLDRLDPDHIFRLFNIFSAHTHSITEKNKFGFDKVIFICDIENIRKIYAHKYGFGVDFSGYMDKFYSLKPFEFDHKEHLNNQINNIIKGCEIINVRHDCMSAGWFEPTLTATIKILLNYKLINLRALKQLPSLKVNGESKKGSDFEDMTLRGFIILNILKELFGGSTVLANKIAQLPNGNIVNDNERGYYISSKFSLKQDEENFFLGAFLPFLFNDFARNDNYGDSQGKETIESLGITIDCVRSGNSCKGILIRGNIQSTETGEIVKINLDRLLKRIYLEQGEKGNI
ncbi:P-loop NTPase fold protein [Myroides odoratimimus]|uniref:P-loop NTPase fold protein n=1 Tax=Myroides odoratimimus TaxID=76832 RepID=UPI001CE1AD44|nr:P-loop NTPase fold protein [Myroides odoratimimus]MCA4793925.1 hypothetical protein [Myroides odoratimimus]MCA4821175.1 hypothetical protein [Myroides odoratimimus]MDM1504218.1 hypothetical protein [Myroides odoratimimus]